MLRAVNIQIFITFLNGKGVREDMLMLDIFKKLFNGKI